MENLNMIFQTAGAAAGMNALPLAMAYVPFQQWEDIQEIQRGFPRGTIFRDLDKPFLGREPRDNG